MPASLPRRRLPVLAFAFALALALPSFAAAWPAAGAPEAVTASGGFDWLSRACSWLRAVWPDAGSRADWNGLNGSAGAAAVRPRIGCGGDPNGQRCGPGAAPVHPQIGCGGDPNGQPCGTAAPPAGRGAAVRRGARRGGLPPTGGRR